MKNIHQAFFPEVMLSNLTWLTDPFANASLNIFNYLQGKVAGLQINTNSNPPNLKLAGDYHLNFS